ncbi:hypothetical protein FC56_GL001100 [Lentilactobacillus senioris DSM 24302 = JCM 17472]|uniref:Uncharacterized protein n=1 Tax=Lentilactobacillus senioris DSM 24302 = JCM 17472 TaxID=1423802 RepID=A0A0R2D118_9LACO|nr:hypothetical protein [Lentilactobacillus senioris]KRM94153.1 hypothetical protein FC56_GL001100 [Lentilactobacillus senioris DSM 24302 = JCM 17472]
MSQADSRVQLALIIMYLIGIICLIVTFFFLRKVNGRSWTKFSIGLMVVIMIMAVILNTVFNLS